MDDKKPEQEMKFTPEQLAEMDDWLDSLTPTEIWALKTYYEWRKKLQLQ